MALPQVIFFGVDLVKFAIDFTNFYALYFAISLTLNLEAGYTGKQYVISEKAIEACLAKMAEQRSGRSA